MDRFLHLAVLVLAAITCPAQVTITEYPIPTTNSRPELVCAGPDGNVWFTERLGDKIGKITTAGVITEYPLAAGSNPYGITTGPDGNLWFTEGGGNKIGRITPAGVITEYTIPTPSSFPGGITAGPDGNLWFIENGGRWAESRPPGRSLSIRSLLPAVGRTTSSQGRTVTYGLQKLSETRLVESRRPE
jgi:streptogramin lyase